MDSDLRNLFREWKSSGDPDLLHQLVRAMFRQGWFNKWEQVLSKFNVVQGIRAPSLDAENEWRIAHKLPNSSWPVRTILSNFQKVSDSWKTHPVMVNYAELQEKWPQLGELSLILKETQHNSLALTINWLRWEKDFLVRNNDGYHLIRVVASQPNPNAATIGPLLQSGLGINTDPNNPPIIRQVGSSIWEEFAKRPERILSVSAKFLPFTKLVPEILDQNSDLNKAIETMFKPTRNPAKKWAYHGTSIYSAYSGTKYHPFWKAIDGWPPLIIGQFHLDTLADSGLQPRVSMRQTRAYRKSRLQDRLREKFVYYYSEPLDKHSIYMLVTSYGSGLVMDAGGLLLRFPEPRPSWPDPDTGDQSCRMTTQAIAPENIEVLVPPKRYYQLLGGQGNPSWSAWDLADQYLLRYCIHNDKYWQPLTSEVNPWENQEDEDLSGLGKAIRNPFQFDYGTDDSASWPQYPPAKTRPGAVGGVPSSAPVEVQSVGQLMIESAANVGEPPNAVYINKYEFRGVEEWVLTDNFERGYPSLVYRDGLWYWRESGSGEDSLIEGGQEEAEMFASVYFDRV